MIYALAEFAVAAVAVAAAISYWSWFLSASLAMGFLAIVAAAVGVWIIKLEVG